MGSQLKVDTITGVTTAGSVAVTGEGNSTTTNLQQGLCKHWVRFDPLNSNNLDDSFNNGAVTDGGVGIFTFTNTNNMGNANHAPLMSGEIQSNYQDAADSILASGLATTSMKGYHVENNTGTDNGIFTMATFGDLA